MKTKLLIAAVVALSAVGTYSYAGDNDAKVTGMVGGAATGAVLGGPVGAVIGGAAGLTLGAGVDDSHKSRTVIIQKQQPDVIIQQQLDDPDVVIDNQ